MADQDFSLLLNIAPNATVEPSTQPDTADGFVQQVGDALRKQESGGKQLKADGTPVTSKKGAIGIMQVMPDTAPEAARLAGLEFDDLKYRTDREYNIKLGEAYLKKQYEDFGGNPALALAAYNAGPGRLRTALATAEKNGTPDAWLRYMPAETQAYVPAILNKTGRSVGKSGSWYSNVNPRGPGATAGDYAKEVAASAVEGVGSIAQMFGEGMAAIANKATGTEDYEGFNPLKPVSGAIRDSMTAGGQRARQEAGVEGSVLDLLSGDAQLPGSGEGWGMMAANGFGSLASFLLPALGPAQRVASLSKAARAAELAGDTAKAAELTQAAQSAAMAARVTGSGVGGAMTGGAAADEVRQTTAQTIQGMTHEQLLQSVPVYAEAFKRSGDQQQARNAVINSAARWAGGLSAIAGAAGGAFNTKVIEDLLVGKGISTMLGNSAASRAGRAAIGGVGGAAAEGLQETSEKVGQNVGENIALGREPGQDALRNTAGDFLGGFVVGGPIGAGGGFVAKPSAPNPLQSVADQAQKPGSVLSRAVVATGAVEQAGQAAQAAQDAVNQDPIAARAAAVYADLNQEGMLDKIRGFGPETSNEFLYALGIARNPNLDPQIREKAINQVEQVLATAKSGTGFVMQNEAPKQPGTALAVPPTAGTAVAPADLNGQFFDPNIIDAEAVRVDNMLPGPKALPGPQRGLTTQQPTTREQPAAAPEPTATPVAQQNVAQGNTPLDAARAVEQGGIGSMTEVKAPRVETPAGAGPAVMRKRKAVVQQLAENGFETVQRDGNEFWMVNSKTGQKFKLDGAADAQLARKAINDRIDALAHTAAASPKNDLLEPTEAQIAAGNYKKSDVIELNGMKIKIENPQGSIRRGTSPDGTPWETKMAYHYGEFQGTVGADGDKLDVFLGPRKDSDKIYVIDQVNQDGSFDEHKVMMGFTTEADARAGYLANYEPGWTGLGAITEMTQDEFKAWSKSRAAKKPLSDAVAAGKAENFTKEEKAEEAKIFSFKANGKQHNLKILKPAELPKNTSAKRGDEPRALSQAEADMIQKVAGLLGKQVVFYEAQDGRIGDGFVFSGRPDTIFVASETTVNPLAVFGHEFFHTLRDTNPEAWNAIAAVVRTKVSNPQAFRENYYGAEKAAQRGDAALSEEQGGELEELVSDLGGNLLKHKAFWLEVFAKIKADNGAEAKGIIAKLATQVKRVIDRLVKSLNQPGYQADRFVKDLDEVRAAFVDAMAGYLKDSGITQRAMAAEKLKAEQKIKKSEDRPEGLTLTGYHFSQQPRKVLSSATHGAGLQDANREQFQNAADERLRDRIYFYVDKGTGITPLPGLGTHAHRTTLTNVYDMNKDPLGLRKGKSLEAFESAVLDSGYDGYLDRRDGTQPGVVIMLGKRSITPEYLGQMGSIQNGEKIPGAEAPEVKQEPIKKGLMSKEIADINVDAIPGATLRAGTLTVPVDSREQANAELERIGSAIRFSPARESDVEIAKREYAEVEAKYKGTDQWMKAPDGTDTMLSERQWVQVRTPSFKQWFGDWEQAHKDGGVWATNLDVSKVVTANGEPMVVYHGTDKGGFNYFKTPGGKERGDLGIFTTPNLAMAQTYYSRRGGEIELRDKATVQELLDDGYDIFETDDGKFEVYSKDGYMDNVYDTRAEAEEHLLDNYGDEAPSGEDVSGYYALFVNIRSANEEDFNGALWNGEREQPMYRMLDENGEPTGDYVYTEEDADRQVEAGRASSYEEEDSIGMTTDDVVREGRRWGADGAIILNVVDSGPGYSSYIDDPSDVFVAFNPEQLKSANFNNGVFSVNEADVRKSTARDYKLDIDREQRVRAKAARLDVKEIEAIDADAKELNLSKKQVKAIVDEARRIKKAFPTTQGWAPLTVVGIELKQDDEGNPIPGSEKPKFQALPYAFNVPPGRNRAPAKTDTVWLGKVADKFEGLVSDIYERAAKGDKNAQIIIGHQTWYRNVAEVLRREYGGSGDLLADLLGATSPNTPVDTNWRFSLDVMRRFMAGDFNDQLAKFSAYIDEGKDASKYPAADKIRQISGKLYGMNSTNAMKALVDMWRVIEPGQAPKARNFALNLIGQSNMATIDVWAARMLRRAANMVRGADLPRIPPVAETGVSGVWNADGSRVTGAFGFGADVMDKVSRALAERGINVTPPDLQAIAWFAEKELWGQKGWTSKTGEGGSFEENIEATPVERYLAGWSIQQGEKVPNNDEASVAQARVLSILVGDDSVVAARVMPTSGLYGGTVEASFDTEWTATKGQHDPSMVMAEIARIAEENNQYDIFVSKVLGPKDDSANARPGVEIYFKSQRDLATAMPILEKFTSRGQDGFTMAVDPRVTPKGVTGESFIGVRLQYVPEISMRWDEDLRDELLAPGGIERAIQEKRELLNDIAAEVRGMDGVAFAAMQNYDTVVVGKENYREYIDRIAEGGDRAPGGEAWFGSPLRQGLERAASRLRGDLGQDGARGVSDAGGEVRAGAAGQVLKSPARPAFYSQLQRAIEQVPQRLATMAAPAWKQWLTANASKLGIKADEIEWSGIKDFLDLQGKNKLTKDDLVAYLDDSGVKISEVTLTQSPNEGVWIPEDSDEEYAPEPERPAKYIAYTLPGGENYRELLITLPEKAGDYRVVNENGDIEGEGFFDREGAERFRADRERETGDNMIVEADRMNGGYLSSHWDEPNILAHIRVNDRTDADGKRVLFVEELQSDWGQEGKKKGFKQEVDRPGIEARMQAITARLREIAKTVNSEDVPELQAEWNRLSDEKSQLTEQLVRSNQGVPLAPFVTKTEGWLNLALKRIAMMAVEGGYDKVAFVNGEQSADRYDLSKQVDSISYEPTAKGYYINVMAGGSNIKNGDFTAAELEDIVGKEIVQKMDSREGQVEGTPGAPDYEDLKDIRTLSGEGLRVGGEGMKTFYDKIVPQAISKLLPKLGGEKLSSVVFGGEDVGGRYVVFDEDSGERLFRTDSRKEANEYRLAYTGDAVIKEVDGSAGVGLTGEQSGFDVTDKMRETVGQGVALFSRDRQTDTPEFKEWFGDSKVVDADGNPLVVYHGTASDFSVFDRERSGRNYVYRGGNKGFFFTNRPIPAGVYAEQADGANFGDEENPRFGNGGANIMPVYLSLQNPYERKATGSPDKWFDYNHDKIIEAAEKAGADGVIIRGGKGFEVRNVYIAFRPEQIKSAIGNNGNFDPTNPDIRKSADRPYFDDLSQMKVTANYNLGDLLKTSKKLSWWDRTIGTQYNLAQKHPQFKRVFDAVQRFINDVSVYATRAADLAPNILPKLESWKDIGKTPLSAEDVKALRDPIFGGTLKYTRDDEGNIVETEDVDKAGVVFTNDELKELFGLNDRQIGLYREFRRATNKSLSDLAVSDMLRYLGTDSEGVRQQALDAKNLDGALNAMIAHLDQLIEQQPTRAKVLEDSKRAIKEKAGQAIGLMARGYAPLSRFGEYTVYAVGKDGEQLYFSMFESERDANKMAREMQEQYPDATVTQGTMSQESYKLFSGVTPETLALFGESLGLEESGVDAKSEAFQQYLKMAKTNRSAMKRLIERKGINGFSEDVGRVLAGFVYSNARQTSTNLHAGEIGRSVQAIDQRDGDVKDAAVRLMEYVQNPREEAQAIRGMLFTQFIGGSIASAMVNLTQPFTMTLPYLSQFGGAAGAAKRMGEAVKMASRGIRNDDELAAALKRAEDEGIVSPQEVHQLMAQAQGKGQLQSGDGTKAGDAAAKINNAMAKLQLGWGKVFSAAEQFNRRVTFIAAYKLARDQGMADPMAFAQKAIAETQGVYNKGNKPAWARGAVGGTLFTFKQYSIGYVEFLRRMWGNGPEGKKAVGLALAVLFLASGLTGMPGADDLDDVIDGFMQRVLGRSFDSKQAKKEFFASILGQAGAEFVMSGLSGLPGVPIDLSGRMGLGNLVPGTGLLTKKRDYGRDYLEILGPAGTFFTNIGTGVASIAQGEFGKAAEAVAPVAAQNWIKSADMATMGYYRDQKGRKVVDTDAYDAFAKALGFQPKAVAQVQEATGAQQNLITQNKLRETEIADKWARGRIEKKPDLIEEAKQELADWNRNNPESRISIDAGQINKRVQEANKSKAQRVAATAPKEIRAAVKKELERVD
jgi:hypothetical protein